MKTLLILTLLTLFSIVRIPGAEARWDTSVLLTPQKVVVSVPEPAKLIKVTMPETPLCRIQLIRDASGNLRTIKMPASKS